ncbi:DNA ligase 1-like [Solenopsis invicta]|uniref:DNA ligase 1-like n=1 Tax=Solenopsis invicta TaxID=13686 RepID=UPI00193E9B46|nr:DNA ligase 1-like [Solenopsis invicta]
MKVYNCSEQQKRAKCQEFHANRKATAPRSKRMVPLLEHPSHKQKKEKSGGRKRVASGGKKKGKEEEEEEEGEEEEEEASYIKM